MIVDLTQEEIDLLKLLINYLVDYLGYTPTGDELLLIESVKAKLGET